MTEPNSASRLDQIFEALSGLTRGKHQPQSSHVPAEGQSFLLVGLGNPGREYARTRHNIGFLVIDSLAERLGLQFTRTQSRALITDGRYQGQRVYLAKPQTYMNASGQAVGALLKFYKIPTENLLVIYDDVDLPFASLRMKPGGGTAGHKGMRSITQQLGTQDFPRLRMGVGRPPGQKQAADYVLKPFSAQEDAFLGAFLARGADASLAYLTRGIMDTMTEFNRSEG